MTSIVLLVKTLLLIVLTYLTYSVIKYIQQNGAIQKTAIKIFNVTEQKYKLRKDIELARKLEDGEKEKYSFIQELDLMIERSGLRKKMPFLNTEVYIAITIILSIIGFMIGNALTRIWLFGLLITMVIILSSYALIYILSGVSYEKTDKAILPFINILENYSGASDDIVSILGRTYPYIDSPLKDYVEEFYNEATTSGDITRAFRNLEAKIENERFKEIIRNIEICSRHEANYQEIIRDTRNTLMDYLEEKQKRKAIISHGRVEIVMSIVLSSVMVAMFTSFVPNLFGLLIDTPIGNGILLYCIFVACLCVWNMISFDKKG